MGALPSLWTKVSLGTEMLNDLPTGSDTSVKALALTKPVVFTVPVSVALEPQSVS